MIWMGVERRKKDTRNGARKRKENYTKRQQLKTHGTGQTEGPWCGAGGDFWTST